MLEHTLRIDEAVDRMGDRGLFLEVAGFFAQSIPETQEKLTAMLQRGDWAAMRRLAHSLKSNCAAIGAEELRALAHDLEKACHNCDDAVAGELCPTLCEGLEGLRKVLLTLE